MPGSSSHPYPTPPSSEEALRSAKRRRLQNSSDESAGTIQSNLSESGYTSAKYRVGAPALHLLPLKTADVDKATTEYQLFRLVVPLIKGIMMSKTIAFDNDDINLVYRTIPGDRVDAEAMTIYIVAEWEDQSMSQWLLAVNDIRELLTSNFNMRPIRDIKIEMIAWEAEAVRSIDIVEHSHPIVSQWPTIRHSVHAILAQNQTLNDGWRSIDVIRLGPVGGTGLLDEPIPLPVVISITVDWGLNDSDWLQAEQMIEQILRNNQLNDVKVEFERGDVFGVAFPLRDHDGEPRNGDVLETAYTDQVSIGSNFGPAKYFTRAPSRLPLKGPFGTIGGYLVAKKVGEKPIKLGISNHHTIRQVFEGFGYEDIDRKDTAKGAAESAVPQGSQLQKLDMKGFGRKYEGRQKMILEAPSRRAHIFTLASHKQLYQDAEEEANKATGKVKQDYEQSAKYNRQAYDEKKAFFDNEKHILGVPWMCSGLASRTKLNRRLDWSLIELKPNRIGDNTIPAQSTWGKLSRQIPFGGRQIKGIASCEPTHQIGQVFKVGAQTGQTGGKFNHIKADVKMPWDKEYGFQLSSEYAFIGDIGLGQRFSEQGDSGAMVFNARAEWLGLLFGGVTKMNVVEKMYVYVTEAQEVLNHMEKLTMEEWKFELPDSDDEGGELESEEDE